VVRLGPVGPGQLRAMKPRDAASAANICTLPSAAAIPTSEVRRPRRAGPRLGRSDRCSARHRRLELHHAQPAARPPGPCVRQRTVSASTAARGTLRTINANGPRGPARAG